MNDGMKIVYAFQFLLFLFRQLSQMHKLEREESELESEAKLISSVLFLGNFFFFLFF